MFIFSALTNLFGAPPEQLVTLEAYYADLLCGERLEVFNPLTDRWQSGRITDVAESIYLGEGDTYRAYWVADDGGFSEWLLVDDCLSELGLE